MIRDAEWLSPAIVGLLRQLPPYNQPFPPGQKEKWWRAFVAIVDHDYPVQQGSATSGHTK